MPDTPFVPPDFVPPDRLATPAFVLEPLGPQHNERDYAAWTSSIDHVRATPGFPDGSWPREMTLDENRGDLERHQRDFVERKGSRTRCSTPPTATSSAASTSTRSGTTRRR